jgi:ArsR family transcriptional regulator, lead/cadmium/zinc/bismuth-responsive transcriptional repressor
MNTCSYDKVVLTAEQNAQLAEIFKLLADPTRLRIVFACLDRTVAVGDIAAELALSASLVSHHLRLLRASRVVRAERQGKHVFYSAADDHIRSVLKQMAVHAGEPPEAEESEEADETVADAIRR